MAAGKIRVGIGGWIFEPWRETFYPKGLAKTKELSHASRQVTAIEINGTFYRTQTPQTFRKWGSEVPDDFVFALKATRYACNRKDLAEAGESIRHFTESGITELGPKLGPILWQLAPTKRFRAQEIEGFLAAMPKAQDGVPLHHVIEPRHESFVDRAFVDLARRYGVAICFAVHDSYPLIADQTGDVSYMRLQTTAEDAPNGYENAALARWAACAKAFAEGRAPADLARVDETAPGAPHDCYVFVIGGAKQHNPAAAKALIAALA